ncbi:GNAT family N-acetyltransferase [Vibrio vulnificus]|nr:GNAT family N-acetyltransferase [Vibrio vulnificus]EKO5188059.1 GNAT family N-acetyltransferase [Vibrio vulnificus]ELH7807995.1 GNAT family N-acetyltransferase [Vibrio vulnificus]MCU8102906.1 GNAT family N-acetyltransferase [Vibrio vulnificus]MCU8457143.1 GNAT family N-acetyltransferase [Vibrio vulnificus]
METERLKLLPPSMKYQPMMLEAILESQDELGVYLPWVPYALTEAESIENTKRAISNFENFEAELRYSIIEKSTGRFLGAIGLIIRDKAVPYFEIGYWLRSSNVGYGFISEAIKAVETYAFKELKANRLEIKAAEHNLRSRSVAERGGYTFEGILRNNRRLPSGELSGTAVYAKTGL